jgi:hypothetical protein
LTGLCLDLLQDPLEANLLLLNDLLQRFTLVLAEQNLVAGYPCFEVEKGAG